MGYNSYLLLLSTHDRTNVTIHSNCLQKHFVVHRERAWRSECVRADKRFSESCMGRTRIHYCLLLGCFDFQERSLMCRLKRAREAAITRSSLSALWCTRRNESPRAFHGQMGQASSCRQTIISRLHWSPEPTWCDASMKSAAGQARGLLLRSFKSAGQATRPHRVSSCCAISL